MKTSESIGNIALALAKAQAEMANAQMTGYNSHFKAKYATLSDIIAATRGPLTKHGLSFVQLPDDQEGGVCVHTVLMHESGEWISSLTAIPIQQRSAHSVGSALTYARRFGLQSMCGVAAADEDDDANIATTGSRDPAARIQEIVDLLFDAMERDDKHGWWEIWSDLKPQQIDYLFSQGTRYLSSKMKTYSRNVQWEMNKTEREANEKIAAEHKEG